MGFPLHRDEDTEGYTERAPTNVADRSREIPKQVCYLPFTTGVHKRSKFLPTMTYIDYVNQFWKTHQSVAFSSNEVYLYFFLLNECNSRGWENPFECPNRRIVLATGISEPTVIEVRNRLQQKGLLQFESGKKNAKSPVYYLNDLSKPLSKLLSNDLSKPLSKRLTLI